MDEIQPAEGVEVQICHQRHFYLDQLNERLFQLRDVVSQNVLQLCEDDDKEGCAEGEKGLVVDAKRDQALSIFRHVKHCLETSNQIEGRNVGVALKALKRLRSQEPFEFRIALVDIKKKDHFINQQRINVFSYVALALFEEERAQFELVPH